MEVSLIVSDLDGTLVNSDIPGYSISDELKEHLGRLRNAGILFTIATGRPVGSCTGIVNELKIEIPYIVCNGSQIARPDGSIIYDCSFKLGEWMPFIERITGLEGTVIFYIEGRPYCINRTGLIKTYEQKEKVECFCLSKESMCGTMLINKILLIGDRKKYLREWEKLDESFKTGYQNLKSEDTYFEIIRAGISKAAALEELKKHIGYSGGAVVAIGNHLNDYELLKNADIGFAVANAEEELKEVADAVTTYEYEKGVIEVIKKALDG